MRRERISLPAFFCICRSKQTESKSAKRTISVCEISVHRNPGPDPRCERSWIARNPCEVLGITTHLFAFSLPGLDDEHTTLERSSDLLMSTHQSSGRQNANFLLVHRGRDHQGDSGKDQSTDELDHRFNSPLRSGRFSRPERNQLR